VGCCRPIQAALAITRGAPAVALTEATVAASGAYLLADRRCRLTATLRTAGRRARVLVYASSRSSGRPAWVEGNRRLATTRRAPSRMAQGPPSRGLRDRGRDDFSATPPRGVAAPPGERLREGRRRRCRESTPRRADGRLLRRPCWHGRTLRSADEPADPARLLRARSPCSRGVSRSCGVERARAGAGRPELLRDAASSATPCSRGDVRDDRAKSRRGSIAKRKGGGWDVVRAVMLAPLTVGIDGGGDRRDAALAIVPVCSWCVGGGGNSTLRPAERGSSERKRSSMT